jgi:tripartite-type tricarboxylate transporter receptor subunit TctC
MRLSYRSLLGALLLGLAMPLVARAQDYPSRPLTMVVAAAAGGPIDVFGRIMSERMGEVLGKSVVIENVGGAGGMLGGQRAAKAEPDGHTFILGTIATHTFSQLLYKKPLYNAVNDFTPVALVAELPLVLIARKTFPADTIEQFAAYAKANPGKINYGSAGRGSAAHLGCLLLEQAIGMKMTHVPYRGTAPAMQDLQAGQIDIICDIIVTAVPQIEANAVKAIANLSRERSAMLPNLPTASERGLTAAQAYTWVAVYLPKGVPDVVVKRLHAATLAAIETPSVRDRLAKLGASIVGPERRSPEVLARFTQSELDKWKGPVEASGAIE